MDEPRSLAWWLASAVEGTDVAVDNRASVAATLRLCGTLKTCTYESVATVLARMLTTEPLALFASQATSRAGSSVSAPRLLASMVAARPPLLPWVWSMVLGPAAAAVLLHADTGGAAVRDTLALAAAGTPLPTLVHEARATFLQALPVPLLLGAVPRLAAAATVLRACTSRTDALAVVHAALPRGHGGAEASSGGASTVVSAWAAQARAAAADPAASQAMGGGATVWRVTPWLLVGSAKAAAAKATIPAITHVLEADGGGGGGVPRACTLLRLGARLAREYPLLARHYWDAACWLDAVQASHGVAFVRCADGVNLSAAIVTAYLAGCPGGDLHTAVTAVAASMPPHSPPLLQAVHLQRELLDWFAPAPQRLRLLARRWVQRGVEDGGLTHVDAAAVLTAAGLKTHVADAVRAAMARGARGARGAAPRWHSDGGDSCDSDDDNGGSMWHAVYGGNAQMRAQTVLRAWQSGDKRMLPAAQRRLQRQLKPPRQVLAWCLEEAEAEEEGGDDGRSTNKFM